MGRTAACRLLVRVSLVVLASCTVISGASELTVDNDDAGPSALDATVAPDLPPAPVQPDGSDVDAKATDAEATCDEPGLVAYWKFDEGSGGDVHDCTSNALDGKLEGGAWLDGRSGAALAFDGGGWASFGATDRFRLGGKPFTVTAWVNQAINSSTTQYVVGRTSNPATRGWRLGVEDDAGTFVVSNGNAQIELPSASVATGTWTHLAAIYRPGVSTEVFVNGQKRTRTTGIPAAIPEVDADELRVGARSDGQFPFYGVIDEVRLYDRALSEAEIAALAAP